MDRTIGRSEGRTEEEIEELHGSIVFENKKVKKKEYQGKTSEHSCVMS